MSSSHRIPVQSPQTAAPQSSVDVEPITAPNGVQWVAVPGWDQIPWLWHGFSTRRGGVTSSYAPEGAPGELNLGFTADDDRDHVLRNRQLFAEAISGTPDTPIVTVRQIHSQILIVHKHSNGGSSSQPPCEGDGLMTDQPGILLGIQTADCVPVLVADLKRKAVAAFHAGWRGTVKRIVEDGIARMRLEFGSDPEDLVAAIGPAIASCCYSVGEEVRSEFESQFPYGSELFSEVHQPPGHAQQGPSLHLDLHQANRRQLLAAGLKPESIQCVGGCTACQPTKFFSHRASRGRAGRMLSVIGINPM
jgi:YfiH family protein